MNRKTYDFLIVGLGLAGALLVRRLCEAGCSVMVIDRNRGSASRTAAGLINPVTGKRLVLRPDIETLLPAATARYRQLESIYGVPLLTEKPMLRIFRTAAEAQAWQQRCKDPAYRDYLDAAAPDPRLLAGMHAPFGAGMQRHTAFLDTNGLLDAIRNELAEKEVFTEAFIDHHDISPAAEGVAWRNIRAERLVFCEGWHATRNPWFGWLPLQPAKGEIVTLHSDDSLPDCIINNGKWLLPLDRHTFKAGATYECQQLDESPTPEAARLLAKGSDRIMGRALHSKLLDHRAGVRPGTRDKQPLVGSHPDHHRMYVFNGFGSKGSLMIPWHVERLADHLLNGTPLPPAADIRRLDG